MRSALVVLVAATVTLGSCSEARKTTLPAPDNRPHLVPLRGCKQVEEAIRRDALDSLSRTIDSYLVDYPKAAERKCAAAGRHQPSLASPSGQLLSYSQANIQVPGVDEPDIVRNDDRYIHVLSGTQWHIVEAVPAESARVIARVPIEGRARSMFVDGNTAVVFSAIDGIHSRNPSTPCIKGDCRHFPGPESTLVSIFDLESPYSPRLLRTMRLSGKYGTARRLGSVVHLVVSDPVPYLPAMRKVEDAISCPPPPVERARKDLDILRKENTRIINSSRLEDWPSITTSVVDFGIADPPSNSVKDCPNYHLANGPGADTLVSIVSFVPARDEPIATTTLQTASGTAYASTDAFYLSVPRPKEQGVLPEAGAAGMQATSVVHKVRLNSNPPSSSYAASGLVKGYPLNQFAMDEHRGYLRIATSTPRTEGGHSSLTVLRQEGDSLMRVGIADFIGAGDDMKSVRFDGDRGYVVTFRTEDPLFVIDLSEPERPRIVSDLKVPGFSKYMHRVEPNHLLTVGYEGEGSAGFGRVSGVALQLFDVGEPARPRLAHKLAFGFGSSSDSLNDHLAFLYMETKGIALLPLYIRPTQATGKGPATERPVDGLGIFGVSPESGLSYRGGVEDVQASPTRVPMVAQESRSRIVRSVVLGDYVYAISVRRVIVRALSDPAKEVTEVQLAAR